MSPDAFRHWRERKALTLDAAARALGVSRRMVAYYEQGAKPIPRVVALATRGSNTWDKAQKNFGARPWLWPATPSDVIEC